MNDISLWTEQLLARTSIHTGLLSTVAICILCAVVAALAWLTYVFCLKVVSPLLMRLARKTDVVWDDYLFNPQFLHSVCLCMPALVVLLLLPPLFYAHPTLQMLVGKAAAIYMTVAVMRLAVTLIGSFKLFDSTTDKRTAAQQYFHSFCGVMKIVVLFLGVIVIVSILIGRSPLTLLAGLGATSAILMLVFKDSITGLVAGIRLTSNNMVCKGDWITMEKAGINGIVEDITLSTVKVRNFDQTIVTVPPQKLIEDSFQNWQGMQEGEGRRVKRCIYIDFHSIGIMDPEMKHRLLGEGLITEDEAAAHDVNLTLFRLHAERWLSRRDDVLPQLTYFVRQLQPTSTGLPIEVYFFLRDKEWTTYEHHLAEIMEQVYAMLPRFGLKVYQRV